MRAPRKQTTITACGTFSGSLWSLSIAVDLTASPGWAPVRDHSPFQVNARGDEMRTTEHAPTRADYMAHRVSHADYYRALAKTAGVSYSNADPAFLRRVKAALSSGDEHLNSIPLRVWDRHRARLCRVNKQRWLSLRWRVSRRAMILLVRSCNLPLL